MNIDNVKQRYLVKSIDSVLLSETNYRWDTVTIEKMNIKLIKIDRNIQILTSDTR